MNQRLTTFSNCIEIIGVEASKARSAFVQSCRPCKLVSVRLEPTTSWLKSQTSTTRGHPSKASGPRGGQPKVDDHGQGGRGVDL